MTHLATNTNRYSETELVSMLKAKDNSAYLYLYENYKSALFGVIQPFFPSDSEQAEDILQEVFMAVWHNIEKYDASKGRLYTWLHTLSRNTSINKLRSKEFKSSAKNDNIENYVTVIEQSESGNININAIGLRKAVHQLKKEFRDVLELGYFNGFTQEEISKTLEIPLGTVKTRMRNALIELRKNFV